VRRYRQHRANPSQLFDYVPAHLLDGQAHVMVDGAPRRGTVHTLSHWPHTPTPVRLLADLSTETVRLALADPDDRRAADLVSIDHYDVDGVVALGLLVCEGLDAAHGPLLAEAARVGDFDVVTEARAAQIAFALNALELADEADEADEAVRTGTDPLARVGQVAQRALDVLPELAADPGRFEALWREEWAAYQWSVRALAEGWATIEERPTHDLAVLRLESGHRDAFRAAWGSAPLHPAAVHSATPLLRVATVAGDRMEFHFRYESWVRLAGPRPRARVDLERLAQVLSAAEATARWRFDGAGSITGSLHLVGAGAVSGVEPECFVELLTTELAQLDDGPAAWDPY
jgi:hypothetical protein